MPSSCSQRPRADWFANAPPPPRLPVPASPRNQPAERGRSHVPDNWKQRGGGSLLLLPTPRCLPELISAPCAAGRHRCSCRVVAIPTALSSGGVQQFTLFDVGCRGARVAAAVVVDLLHGRQGAIVAWPPSSSALQSTWDSAMTAPTRRASSFCPYLPGSAPTHTPARPCLHCSA